MVVVVVVDNDTHYMNLQILFKKTDKMKTTTRSQVCVSDRIMDKICCPCCFVMRSFFHGTRPATAKFRTESITTASTPDTCNVVFVGVVVAGTFDEMATWSRGSTNARPLATLCKMRSTAREIQFHTIMIDLLAWFYVMTLL